MPAVTDIMKFGMVQELDGVQMSNDLFYRLDDLGDAPTLPDAIADFVTLYMFNLRPIVAASWKLVCVTWDNISQVEVKQILFTSEIGTAVSDSHPQSQVLRFNMYARDATPPIRVLRGAVNQSGVGEEFSTRGRANDAGAFVPFRNFLSTQQILAGPGWTITPMQRIRLAGPGPPIPYAYFPITHGAVSRRFLKLRRRTTALCAAG